MEENEWSEYYTDASVAMLSTDELKAALPIAYVLEDAGIEVEQVADGKLRGSCPFHTDNSPSFDVFGPDLEKWGCYPCGLNGDVFDLVGKLHGITEFKDVRNKAIELLSKMQGAEWDGPRKSNKKPLDTDFVKQVVDGALASDDFGLIDALLEAKNAPYTAAWLHDTFGVGVYGSWIVIPYADSAGVPLTFKHRTPTTKPHSLAGSEFGSVLYAEWRDDPALPVVLCEGESDVWAATYALPAYSVMGLPTGAGTREGGSQDQVARLKGRKVVLAFDGDKAGRTATRKWHSQLTKAGCTVLIAPVTEGEDISTSHNIPALVEAARPIMAIPGSIKAEDRGYIRPAVKDTDVPNPITNWTFEPQRELLGEGGSAYEGTVKPSGADAVLSSFDLSSKNRMVRWSSQHGAAWYGSDRDAQLLLGLLQAEAPFLSVGRMATVAGLHEGHFIWPGGKIGPDHWQYVTPKANIHLESKVRIQPGKWEPDWILTLRELHEHRVTDPILAWLAAAPLRTLLHEFPTLTITGPAGTGKTTLVDTIVPVFSGADISNTITNTTVHALFAHFGATNAFPIRFDEYRPGARKDTIQKLQQLIRDAYTAQPSSKGGLGEDWAEVTSVATSAPLIITGEDAFDEVSHLERMVSINLPIAGKNRDVLRTVRSWESPNGLSYAYLTWLQEGLQQGYLPEIANYEAGPEELHERNRKNFGVLELGWSLLTEFLLPFGVQLSEPDFSLVLAEAMDSLTHAPIEDAILWALEEADASFFICKKLINGEEYVCMRVENIVQFIKSRSSFVLPGGTTAVRKYLQAKYQAEHVTIEHGGGMKRMIAVKSHLLQLM